MQNAKYHGFILLTLCFSFFFGSNVLASGFWDQGLVSGKVRTDYNQFNRGSYSLPISYTYPSPYFLPCNASSACGNSPTGFSQSNSWSNGNFWSPNYWVLSFNNEDSYNKRDANGNFIVLTNNPGPPNQSLPRSVPGTGMMGFAVMNDIPKGEYFKRAHMVMNKYFPNPNPGGIPYMSIGAQSNRGNGGYSGYINGGWWLKDNVHFKAKLFGQQYTVKTPNTNEIPALFSYIFVMTEWGGKQRGLFIHLYHWNMDVSDYQTPGTNLKWNWPINQSFYYPGADIAYMDAEDVVTHCGFSVPRLQYAGQEISYNLDLTALFQCASNNGLFQNPMSNGSHPIKGVHWVTEATGVNGYLWVAVHDMKMY